MRASIASNERGRKRLKVVSSRARWTPWGQEKAERGWEVVYRPRRDRVGGCPTREIHQRWPAIRIIVLTTFDDDEYVYEALRAGAAGYLLKNADPDHLARAIRAVYAGQSILDPAVTQKVIQYFTRATATQPAQIALTERLTDRERAVLRGMVDGLSNNAIAEQLSLSEGTVKNHLTHIFQKLDVKDRAQAVRRAVEWGLLHE